MKCACHPNVINDYDVDADGGHDDDDDGVFDLKLLL